MPWQFRKKHRFHYEYQNVKYPKYHTSQINKSKNKYVWFNYTINLFGGVFFFAHDLGMQKDSLIGISDFISLLFIMPLSKDSDTFYINDLDCLNHFLHYTAVIIMKLRSNIRSHLCRNP